MCHIQGQLALRLPLVPVNRFCTRVQVDAQLQVDKDENVGKLDTFSFSFTCP